MEKKGKVVIKLNDLPARAEKLTHDKIVGIFGGCKDPFKTCLKSSECLRRKLHCYGRWYSKMFYVILDL